MAEVEQKIKITTEFVDNSSKDLQKAKGQVLDFAKAAEKAGKDIGKNLGEGTKDAAAGAKGLAATFSGLKTATLAYVAAAAAVAVGIYKVVQVITEAQETTKKFTFALSNAGITSQLGVAKFKAFAESIQNTTKYSDGAIISLGTFFTNAGIGYDKLQTATKAAVEYSAAFGTTLEEAGNAVAASFNGQTRELGKYIPEIKNLSDAQLRAGEAADILIKKFGGSAAQEKDTLMGSLLSAKNALMSLVEAFGTFLMPVINAFSYAINNIARSVKMLNDVIDKMTGKKKEMDSILNNKEAAVELNKQVIAQTKLQKIEQDRSKWKEAHKDDQKTFEDLKKQADAEKGSALDQIRTEYQQRIDAINKLTAVEKDKRFDLITLEYQLRDKKMQEQLNKEAKERQKKADEQLTNVTNLGSAAISGNASGVASGVSTTLGSTGPQGALIALVTELVVNSKDIPNKISSMISGLSKGIAEGIPILIHYLSSQFIPDLINGLTTALSGLIKSLPGMALDIGKLAVRSSLAAITGGISEAIGGLFGFGGGPSPMELLADTMRKLSDDIKDLNKGLNQTYRGIVSSVSGPGGQLNIAKGDFASLSKTRSDLRNQVKQAAMAGDVEKTRDLLKELASTQQDMMNKAKDIYDLESSQATAVYEKKKELYQKERQLLVDRINELRNLRNTAFDAINKVREAIVSGSSTAFQNVNRLRANYASAATAQSKSDAAVALAGGLQSEFESAQSLASQGAISGEELNRIKQGILSELDSTQGSIQSDFQQLIDVQKAQIKVLDSGFKKVTDSYKKEMDRLRDALLTVAKKLDSLPKYAQGTNYVPNTGLAVLHQGEQVVPRGMNPGNVTININGGTGGGNQQELVKQIRQILNTNQGNFRGAVGRVK